MEVKHLLSPTHIHTGLQASSKKRALEAIATHIAKTLPTIDAHQLFDCLIARERLGSTAIGHGIAIPHCRLDSCTQPIGAFFKLQQAIDFDAIDQQAVDMIFVLLVPIDADQDHLDTLSHIAELMSSTDLRQRIRNTHSADIIYQTLTATGDTEPAPLNPQTTETH